MLFGVNNPGNIVLDGGPDLPTERGHVTYYIALERLQLHVKSPARAVCAVHSMQPLPNYFGLLLINFTVR